MANLTYSLNILSDGSISNNTPIPGGVQYGQVLDKWMVDYKENVFIADDIPMSQNSIPAVWQFVQPPQGYKPIEITKQMSDWWYKLTEEVCPSGYPHNEIDSTLLNLTYWKKAFTNKMGWGMDDDPRNEYWSGDGKGQGYKKNMYLLFCTASGSTYKIIGEAHIAGEDCWTIEAMNALDPNTFTKTYAGNEHLFTIATSNSRDDSRPNGYKVNPFPKLYDRSLSSFSRVLVPLLVNGDTKMYIQKRYIKILGSGDNIPAYPYGYP